MDFVDLRFAMELSIETYWFVICNFYIINIMRMVEITNECSISKSVNSILNSKS